MGKFAFFNEEMEYRNDAARTIHIKSGVSNTDELFKFYVDLLDFPYYFGYNWDAFNECINDLEWIPEYEIIIIHEDIPLENAPRNKNIYLEILSYSTSIWQVDSLHNLIVAFPEKYREEIELLNAGWQSKEANLVQIERERRAQIIQMQKDNILPN